MKDSDAKRGKGGRWSKGTSGNPSGRPRGSRNKVTQLMQGLLEEEAESIGRKAIELAKKGNLVALRLCLERLLPAPKERTIELELRPVDKPDELPVRFQDLVTAVAEGRLTPREGLDLGTLINAHAQSVEADDLARRVEEMNLCMDEVVRLMQVCLAREKLNPAGGVQ